jgi:hypothetical protein
LCLRAPSDSTAIIQQVYMTAGHIVCGLVEERLFPRIDTPRALAAVAGRSTIPGFWAGRHRRQYLPA